FQIESPVLFLEITCAIPLPWRKLSRQAVSTGRSRGLRVSLRKIPYTIEAVRVLHPEWVSHCPEKRWPPSCSTRSSKRSTFAKSSALRSNHRNGYTSALLFWPRRSNCRQRRRPFDAGSSGSYSYRRDGSPNTAP